MTLTRMPLSAQRIAATVAPLITGATFKPSEGMHCDIGYIDVPGGTIVLRPGYGARSNRIDANYSASGMRDAFGTVAPWPAQPACSFATDAPPERIARDIQRKLIDAAAPLLATIAEKLAAQRDADSAALDARAAMERACPAVTLSDYKPGNYCTDWNIPGVLGRGTVSDSGVSFDYLPRVSLDKAARIIAILTE